MHLSHTSMNPWGHAKMYIDAVVCIYAGNDASKHVCFDRYICVQFSIDTDGSHMGKSNHEAIDGQTSSQNMDDEWCVNKEWGTIEIF